MKFKLSILVFVFAVTATFGTPNRWKVYSSLLPIHGAVPYGTDGVMLATEGGVRYRSITNDYVYHSNDGLQSSEIYGIAGTFAVSKNGIVSMLKSDGLSWQVLNRSYVANKSFVVSGAVTLAEKILIIGFEDRLAFFDAPSSSSILTIDRIRSQSLSVNPITAVIAQGDSLFVQLTKGTFVRYMDWNDLKSDVRLVDPDSWIELPADRIVEGLVWDSTNVVVNGKALQNPELFETINVQNNGNSVSYERSLIHQIIPVEKGYFLVGPTALFFYDGSKLTDLLVSDEDDPFPMSDAYEVRALPYGGVIAASIQGDIALNAGEKWRELYSAGVGSNSSAYSSRLKELSVLPSGHVLFHVWGFNFYGFDNWGTHIIFGLNTSGTCLESITSGDENTFMIAVSSIPAPDSSGYLTITGSSKGYGLVYITKEGDVQCANRLSSVFAGAPFYSEVTEDGYWRVFVGARKGSDPTAEGWMDILEFLPPKSNGGELSDISVKSIRGVNLAPMDMAYDSIQKRLWVLTMGSLAYYDETQDTLLQPNVVSGVHGAEYTSIDIDPQGNLWVGTAANGAYRISMKRSSPDTLVAVNYSARDGLLSDVVNDVAVDKVFGKVWFAHNKGVSSLTLSEVRDASKFMTKGNDDVRAYPNPFRPKIHSFYVIDRIAEDAVVSIYNRGGSLIRSFYGEEILGGRLEWDGRDKRGNLVVPGVYYYVVKGSSKVKKGKFIIAH